MSIYANFMINSWPNISHKSNIDDESILSYKMFSYWSNFFIKTKNDDLNFDKFIKDYEAINNKSSHNIYKKFNDVRDFLYSYDANEYIIKQILEKIQEKLQILSFHIYIFLTKTIVKRNDNE